MLSALKDADAQLTIADNVLHGDPVRKILELEGYIKSISGQRDDWMNQCAELRKEVKMLRRRLGQRRNLS